MRPPAIMRTTAGGARMSPRSTSSRMVTHPRLGEGERYCYAQVVAQQDIALLLVE